ncbi:phage terminase small subunit [Sporolactobacillus laevolacticus]|uniref:phage terminase small subunit n=1 Tax=Sporolactobacillus laevolacticus TaxID=33018 RepID=UPI0004180327|nr:phage terminase small subunit [Sporolactobacillus laevolacticus]
MPRPRDPRRDEAKSVWLNSKGELKLVDLAEQMNVTPSTIRKWKAQDKWDNELKGSAPKHTRGHPGGQPGNQNAKGQGPPKRNTNALKFGFFSKYLPEESLDIMNEIQDRPPEDMLGD